jgi:hypothetical protein
MNNEWNNNNNNRTARHQKPTTQTNIKPTTKHQATIKNTKARTINQMQQFLIVFAVSSFFIQNPTL